MILTTLCLRNRVGSRKIVRSVSCWTAGLMAWMTWSLALGDPPAPGDDDMDAQAELLTLDGEHLAAQSFGERQRATMKLWGNREASREAVQRAARDSDPEVSDRAQWILRHWRRGALPETPPEIARLLLQADDPRAIEQLMRYGHFKVAGMAIQESAGTINHEAVHRLLTSSLEKHFPLLISLAIRQDSLPEFLKLVEALANTDEMVLCRVRMLQQMGETLSADNRLPSTQVGWAAKDRLRRNRIVMLAAGRTNELLRQLLEKMDSIRSTPKNNAIRDSIMEDNASDALFNLLILEDRWHEAYSHAKQRAERAKQIDAGSPSDASDRVASWWARAMIAANRGNDPQGELASEEALTEIRKPSDRVESLKWRSLAINGHFQRSMQLATRVKADQRAFAYMGASRPVQAIETLGCDYQTLSLELPRLVEQAVIAQIESGQSETGKEVKQMVDLMQVLLNVGREQDAYFIATKLSRLPSETDRFQVREAVLRALVQRNKDQWVRKLAVFDDETEFHSSSQVALQQTAGDVNSWTFHSVHRAIETLHPQWGLKKQVMVTHDLLRGHVPEDWNPQDDNKRLLRLLIEMKPNTFFVKMFSRLGQLDLSKRYRKFLEQQSDRAGRMLIAKMALETGQIAEAKTCFREIVEESLDDSVTLRSSRSALQPPHKRFDSEDFAKSVVGLYVAAKRSDDQESARERFQQIQWMLCSPSRSLRKMLATEMSSHGSSDLSMTVFQEDLAMMILCEAPPQQTYRWALTYGMLFATRDPVGTAKWFDLALINLIESDRFYDRAYFSLPGLSYRWQLSAAIDSGDLAVAERCVWRLLQYNPLDLEFAENLLPKMRKRGWDSLADQALRRIMETACERIQRFPLDANTANNVAWIAAMNDFHLETARQLSIQAVRCKPEMAIYRDTLAEVLFRLGRAEEALGIEENCLLDSPSDWHFHQQIKRFKSRLN